MSAARQFELVAQTLASTSLAEVLIALQNADNICIVGTGKNYWVARTAAATFASLGLKCVALDTTALLHGDLGFVYAGATRPVVLHISRSGTTDELRKAIPAIAKARRGAMAYQWLLSMATVPVADELFWLDGSLTLPRCKELSVEATGFAEAPTTSCLIFQAVLYSLAMQLSHFTSADFVRYHPGGALGSLG